MNVKKFRENAAAAAELLKTLGNDQRLMILCELGAGEKSVSQLEQKMGLRQSALSQHLARLRKDGLVNSRREAKNVFYSLHDEKAIAIIQALSNLYRGDNKDDCCPASQKSA